MKILYTEKQVQDVVNTLTQNDKTLGFVPTLGALHDGHLTLVRHALEENDAAIVSIFVNPTQFNEKEDLEKYPRTLDEDSALLESIECDYLFAPEQKEIYPDGTDEPYTYSFGGLELEMEGAFRPGHFQGVGQVVKRLLDIVSPTRLYMGQKDFQQFSLIKYMIDDLRIDTSLRVVPIIREEDGLAMSSRNRRLSKSYRKKSALIYRTLLDFLALQKVLTVPELIDISMARFSALEGFRPEYVSVVDGYTLRTIDNLEETDYAVVCAAVWVDGVRLIDNLIIKHDESQKEFFV